MDPTFSDSGSSGSRDSTRVENFNNLKKKMHYEMNEMVLTAAKYPELWKLHQASKEFETINTMNTAGCNA